VQSSVVRWCEFSLGKPECRPVDVVAVLVGPLKLFLNVDTVIRCLCRMPECLSQITDDDVSMDPYVRVGMWEGRVVIVS